MEDLPPGRQLVTTWWIPDQYAGQTTATLHRVGEQVRRSGRPVDLLTFSALQDNERSTALLRERGSLPEGVTLRNLFADLRAWEDEGVLHERLATLPYVAPSPDLGVPTVSEESSRWARRTYDAKRELVHSEMYRADGSVLCRDYPVEVDGERKRYQQFFHPDGTESTLCGATWDAYYLWLDHLVGDGPAVIINESKSTARFLSRYTHPNATTVHLFHESHLADASNPDKGDLYVAHRRIMPHLDRFDAVVFLTRKQRQDVVERFGDSPNLHAVPNAGPPVLPEPKRLLGAPSRPDRGIVVATLKPLKRIEHAIEATALLHGRNAKLAKGLGLDVYGKDAGSQASLEAVIAQTRSAGYVTLHGYTPGAASRFAEASFSLMTSTTEGQSLVLLESMAAGCVPISYDIRYGPAELIVDGETGFLVPPGEVKALADAIERFLSLPGRRVRQLRESARERLAAFSDDEVYGRWIELQRQAVAARPYRLSLTGLDVGSFTFAAAGPTISLTADATLTWDASAWSAAEPPPPPTARLLVVGREQGRPWRHPLTVTSTPTEDGVRVQVAGAFEPGLVVVGEKTSDVYLEVTVGSSVRRHRFRGEAAVKLTTAEIFATGFGNVSLRRR